MPQFAYQSNAPTIPADTRVAPTAVVSGDVTIGHNCSIGFGAVLTAESGPIHIGDNCVVMDGVILRGIRDNPLRIGDNVLIGPHAYLTGCTVERNVFIATGATIFNGAVLGERVEVRINGIVHIRTRLLPDAVVPLGWIAVGDPAEILPPEAHERIWEIQKKLDFPRYVFGVERPAGGESIMPDVMPRYARFLIRRHGGDG
jgi:carbonic anhydrase/acetyltransferase-like protein (isoleucine patch superfamily)